MHGKKSRENVVHCTVSKGRERRFDAAFVKLLWLLVKKLLPFFLESFTDVNVRSRSSEHVRQEAIFLRILKLQATISESIFTACSWRDIEFRSSAAVRRHLQNYYYYYYYKRKHYSDAIAQTLTRALYNSYTELQ